MQFQLINVKLLRLEGGGGGGGGGGMLIMKDEGEPQKQDRSEPKKKTIFQTKNEFEL